ncbi:AAA family ATPase [Rhizobium sp. BR 249]|uniref:AAA family ATPase n=1 Tax=Rhizobium sp. BR 249 TaxID=3040011 RepID=UPI0039BF2BDD
MIKMTKKKDLSRSLEDYAYQCVTRRLLRRVEGFLDGKPGFVILIAQPGVNPADYYPAIAADLFGDDYPERSNCGVMVIKTGEKQPAILGKFDADCRLRHRIVVIASDRECIPSEIRFSADTIIDVPPVSPRDLKAACKTVLEIDITAAQAKEALKAPWHLLLRTLRPGRPIDDVLSRLKNIPVVSETHAPKSRAANSMKLEEMHGYGPAKEWGLQLADDLGDWRDGRISWDDVDKGLLLSGPPGIGKSVFARALALQCGVKLIVTSLGQWQAKGHLGDLLSAMRTDFARAKNMAPCIMLIDEMDSFGDRSTFTDRNKDYSTQVVNALLECLDSLDGREGVVVVAATNNPNDIDPAVLRAGRIDRHIALELPDGDTRLAIIKQISGIAISDDEAPRIKQMTIGSSGADLAKMCREARRLARRDKRPVDENDLIIGLPKLMRVEGEFRRHVAIHEAGHTLVGWRLDAGEFLGTTVFDWINPAVGNQRVGMAIFRLPGTGARMRQHHLDRIACLLGGIAAEELVLGEFSDGAGGDDASDLGIATTLATALEAQLGLGERLRYSAVSDADDWERLRRVDVKLAARVDKVLREQFERAKEILSDERRLHSAIVEVLCNDGKLGPEGLAELEVSQMDHDPIKAA